jgi:hypothetical protein
MQHAAELPKVPATKAIAAAVAALALGVGAGTGAYALIDRSEERAAAPRVIVVEPSAPSADPDLRGSKASATGERAPR